MPSIIQIGMYQPTTNAGAIPSQVTMPRAPTSGNVLIAGCPINATSEGFGINPYWSALFIQAPNFAMPMNWFFHPVEPGEPALLPPFYTGTDTGAFARLSFGAAVWEVAGAAGYDAVPIVTTGEGGPNTSLAMPPTAAPGPCTALCYACGGQAANPSVTDITASGPGFITLATVFPIPDDFPGLSVNSFLAGAIENVAENTVLTFTANFSPPTAGSATAVGLMLFPLKNQTLSVGYAVSLPCSPCCEMSTKIVL